MGKEIIQSFKQTIASDETIGLVKDYAELALDAVLNDGIVKEIPIFSTLISLYKIRSSLRDRHNFKKIAIFLNQLKDIPQAERQDFLGKLNEKDKYRESIFEKVLLMLERLDESQKAEFVGNLFRLYIMEVIDKNKFLRLSGIVERANLYDLFALHYMHSMFDKDWDGEKPYHFHQASHSSLLSFGLMDQKIVEKYSQRNRDYGVTGIVDQVLELQVSSLGKELANYIQYDLNNLDFIEYINEIKTQRLGAVIPKKNENVDKP